MLPRCFLLPLTTEIKSMISPSASVKSLVTATEGGSRLPEAGNYILTWRLDDEAHIFWLIRISMSPNLPESNYSAIGTAEMPLNPR